MLRKRFLRAGIFSILWCSLALWAVAATRPRIQLAILLDTSNSMDGLIDQARSQLWRIVNELATARRSGQIPELEVALWEYGNDRLPAAQGHIRQVVPLSSDLDLISESLFGLRTNGGFEYCGQVIRAAIDKLAWSTANDDLKILFIAGNEPFSQGTVKYQEACREAIGHCIMVNTIFCGDYNEGVSGGWKEGADLADGRYTVIDQNIHAAALTAPQDSEIVRWNEQLNSTYVAYGEAGSERKIRQETQDKKAAGAGSPVAAQRATAKVSEQYRNEEWDLVDGVKAGRVKVGELREQELPEEMKKMTSAERERYVADLAKKRSEIQAQIRQLSQERDKFLEEKRKTQAQQVTLDEAILLALRQQAAKKNFIMPEK